MHFRFCFLSQATKPKRGMNVFLIRTPRPTASLDPYSLAFSTSAYKPTHLPILHTTFLSRPALLSLLRSSTKAIRGIIVTSPRSMESWELALEQLHESERKGLDQVWREVRWFVVGPATRDAVLRVYPGHERIFGDETGSGNALGKFIASHLSADVGIEGGTVVNLIGDKARETIGDILAEAGVQVEKLLVYETCSLEQSFVKDLQFVLPPSVFPTTPHPPTTPTTNPTTITPTTNEEEEEFVCWFVLFSPSGSKAALRLLRQKGLVPPRSTATTRRNGINGALSNLSLSPSPTATPSSPSVPTPPPTLFDPISLPIPTAADEAVRRKEEGRRKIRIKFAVIGPTTKEYLENDEGITVLADAKSPEPGELVRAIREADLAEASL